MVLFARNHEHYAAVWHFSHASDAHRLISLSFSQICKQGANEEEVLFARNREYYDGEDDLDFNMDADYDEGAEYGGEYYEGGEEEWGAGDAPETSASRCVRVSVCVLVGVVRFYGVLATPWAVAAAMQYSERLKKGAP